MNERDLLFAPATVQAELIRRGEVAATELVELSLRQLEKVEPELNAFVEVDAERALAAAATVRPGDANPFAGVPTVIKNNRAVAGLRLTFCAPLLRELRASHDSNVARRLKNAGFIVIGTTTLPEYGILPVTEPTLFGPTRNPWDLSRTPGGSSGGSAAAVAAGVVAVAHANDGGGSIRIPAACCGLVGLKCQRGRVSLAPELAHSLLVVDGMLTRTVADSALLLDILAGPESGDAYWPPPPRAPFAQLASAEHKGLRVALCLKPPLPDCNVDPICLEGARQAATLLEELGHHVEEVEPPWVDEQLAQRFGLLFAQHVASSIHYSALASGRAPEPGDMEPLSYALYQLGRSRNAVEYLVAENELLSQLRPIARFSSSYHVLLTPALAERPLPIGALDTHAAEPLETFTRSAYFTPFTALFNATGQPALTLPLFQGEDGLPLAVQLVGGPGEEGLLLSLGAQLEAHAPWHGRRPPLALA